MTREKKLIVTSDLRQKILNRDNYQCQVCNESDISKLIIFIKNKKGKLTGNNLITLCDLCKPPEVKGSINREPVSANVMPDLIKWLDDKVTDGLFRSRAHGIEESLKAYREYLEYGTIKKIVP